MSGEPVVGDAVILRGRIVRLDYGVALVEVYRSYPAGGTVAVQCGALELAEDPGDGGDPEPKKISGEDPGGEYWQALDEHARDVTPGRERTRRKLGRAWDAYQRHLRVTGRPAVGPDTPSGVSSANAAVKAGSSGNAG